GYPIKGPYDVIFFEGAVDFIPDGVFDQMREGGRLVVVEGHGNAGVARIYVKDDAIISARRAFNLAVKCLPSFFKAP
ncbi:MAG: protein-L-isoaspartate O-methyltransferase, partial [Bartonella sp.]|nr:protein-L-isoaspartate O-methyltransferase [Bartonella sp.]